MVTCKKCYFQGGKMANIVLDEEQKKEAVRRGYSDEEIKRIISSYKTFFLGIFKKPIPITFNPAVFEQIFPPKTP